MIKIGQFIFFTLLCILCSCSVNHFAIKQTKNNLDFITQTAETILKKDSMLLFEVRNLHDTDLKKQLEKLEIDWVEITKVNHYYYPDSLVVFKRWGMPLAVIEIIYDYSMQQRNIATKNYGFILVADRIYYRKRAWVIM